MIELETRDPTKSAGLADAEEPPRVVAELTLRELFGRNPARFEQYSLEACGLLLDYSKNRITRETLPLLRATG